MNITVTIAPSPELSQALQMLANALRGVNQTSPIELVPATAVDPAKPVDTPTAKKAKTESVKEAVATTEQAVQEPIKVTVELLRKTADLKINQGQMAAVKSILAKYDAKTISLLAVEDREAFYTDIKDL